MKKSKFSTEQMRHIVHQLDIGRPVLKLCCEYQISSATIYSWRRRSRQWDAEQHKAPDTALLPPMPIQATAEGPSSCPSAGQ